MTHPHLQVGFLVDNLTDEYQKRVFAGLNTEAVRLNVNVRCFVGGRLAESGSAALLNQLYDCVSAAHLDALVIVTGTIGNFVSKQRLFEFVQGFQPLPTCCVGVEIPGFPAVTIDNRTGMREGVVHLIEDAGRRKIAFLRGPEGNREAEERFLVYTDVLTEYGVGLNPELVTSGDFDASSGAAAVRTLIDDRHVGFDAIVAASDMIALGALNALLERGIPVPERVSVVGFDDVEPARFATAPLTTVRQPLYELGKRALENAVSQAYGEAVQSQHVLPTRLVKRRSSTAVIRSSRIPEALVGRNVTDGPSFEELYKELKTEIVEALRADIDAPGLDRDWPEQLCNAFVAEIGGRRSGLLRRVTFIDYLEHLLLRIASSGSDINACQTMISGMRFKLVPWLREAPAQRDAAEQIWHRARILIAGIAERYQVQQRLQLQHWRTTVQHVGALLLRCDTIEHLGACLAKHLPQLGIPACVVCTFEAPDLSRLRIGYDLFEAAEYPESLFPQRELLPCGVLAGDRRLSLLLETLYANDRALGYVAFEMGPTEAEVYELLRDYLTGALRGIDLDYAAPDEVPEPPRTSGSEFQRP